MKIKTRAVVTALLFAGFLGRAANAECADTTNNLTDCLQCCQENFEEGMEGCKDACEYCVSSTLFGLICLKSATSINCLNYCEGNVKAISESCKAACNGKFKPKARIPVALIPIPDEDPYFGGSTSGLFLGGDF